jgi:hypothetical protein
MFSVEAFCSFKFSERRIGACVLNCLFWNNKQRIIFLRRNLTQKPPFCPLYSLHLHFVWDYICRKSSNLRFHICCNLYPSSIYLGMFPSGRDISFAWDNAAVMMIMLGKICFWTKNVFFHHKPCICILSLLYSSLSPSVYLCYKVGVVSPSVLSQSILSGTRLSFCWVIVRKFCFLRFSRSMSSLLLGQRSS